MFWQFLVAIIIAFVFVPGSYSQSTKKNLKGRVETSAGIPVHNAFIFIDREIQNKTTKSNGSFRLRVPVDADSIIIFTLDGRICGGSIVDKSEIRLVMDTLDVNKRIYTKKEFGDVMDFGYFRREANKMTATVNIIESRNKDLGTYNSIYEMIKGEVPGVWIAKDGIYIRGKGTLQASSAPLIVVDGVPVQSVSHISPANVERISLLKGPAASAYGSRGSNGVIVINLKKK